MAKAEYRMVSTPGGSMALPARLVTDNKHVIVRRPGAAPFVVSRAEWESAPIVKESADGR